MLKHFPTWIKIALLGLSLPLLFPTSVSAKRCTQVEIDEFLEQSRNSPPGIYLDVLCGSEMRPDLITALNNKDENINLRVRAVGHVGSANSNPEANAPILLNIAKDRGEHTWVRSNAISFLGNFDTETDRTVPVLIAILNDRNENISVRSSAAVGLGRLGLKAKVAIPVLIQSLEAESTSIRTYVAKALGDIGMEAQIVVPALVEALKEPKNKGTSVPTAAAGALGSFYVEAETIVPVLIQALRDENISTEVAADALGQIAIELYEEANTLQQIEVAREFVLQIQSALENQEEFESAHLRVDKSLAGLNDKRQLLLFQILGQWIATGKNIWLAHMVVWLALIFAYPKSPQIQAIFFWNPWMRKFFGVGYVGFALTWVPFLRQKLFEPFRESLLADAALENFNPQTYFENSEVKIQPSGEFRAIREAISEFKGQIVLEGVSGLGKSMFLRHFCHQSRRIVVYLPATKCVDGVIEAIQKKLHGEEIKDPKFLQNLIYSGAIAICIDGLNEVSAETRAKIVEFTENYFKGDIILATQPMEWTPPSTAKQYVMQPLREEQIREFLVSRQPLIPDYAAVKGEAYMKVSDRFLTPAFDKQQSSEELEATQQILSNPMDLTVVASILAAGNQPDLFHLHEQQYHVMADEYHEKHLGHEFPLELFSEVIYQMRLDDIATLPEDKFFQEIVCLERHKMVVSRQSLDIEGKPKKEWYFRHDKIAEFFILQAFLSHPEQQEQHLGDPRFRGVYFLLANFLKLEDAIALREVLIQYAADTKDHTVSDTFVQLLRSRKVVLNSVA